MRVLEPQDLHKRRQQRASDQKKRTQRNLLVAFLILVISLIGLQQLLTRNIQKSDSPASQASPSSQSPNAMYPNGKTKLKTFKGEEFRDMYRLISYPNTESFTTPPEITGNTKADARIRKLAEARGFLLTSLPVSPIVKTNEPRLAGSEDDLLQPLALQAWQNLEAAAKNENIPLALNSAFRSPKWQRELFTERLYAQGITAEQIAAGFVDQQVVATLKSTAVPGYSRHHTGYTIDLWCEDNSPRFENSACYKWLNANNYEKTKRYGWIPSYPEDAGLQGPEPEAWEYVWVGTDLLYE